MSSYSCLCRIHWSQMLSWEWRCRSSADSRCFNYIWVINNFIAYLGATYIRGFTEHFSIRNGLADAQTYMYVIKRNVIPEFRNVLISSFPSCNSPKGPLTCRSQWTFHAIPWNSAPIVNFPDPFDDMPQVTRIPNCRSTSLATFACVPATKWACLIRLIPLFNQYFPIFPCFVAVQIIGYPWVVVKLFTKSILDRLVHHLVCLLEKLQLKQSYPHLSGLWLVFAMYRISRQCQWGRSKYWLYLAKYLFLYV